MICTQTTRKCVDVLIYVFVRDVFMDGMDITRLKKFDKPSPGGIETEAALDIFLRTNGYMIDEAGGEGACFFFSIAKFMMAGQDHRAYADKLRAEVADATLVRFRHMCNVVDLSMLHLASLFSGYLEDRDKYPKQIGILREILGGDFESTMWVYDDIVQLVRGCDPEDLREIDQYLEPNDPYMEHKGFLVHTHTTEIQLISKRGIDQMKHDVEDMIRIFRKHETYATQWSVSETARVLSSKYNMMLCVQNCKTQDLYWAANRVDAFLDRTSIADQSDWYQPEYRHVVPVYKQSGEHYQAIIPITGTWDVFVHRKEYALAMENIRPHIHAAILLRLRVDT